MYDPSTQGIIIFIAGITFLLLLLISFIVTIVYKYQQKQNTYFKDLEALKILHQNTLLQSQLEIQEQTFQNISREIHDSIGIKLSLAKLHLNTLNYVDGNKINGQVNESVNIISEAINDLIHISRNMSSEIVVHDGLSKALELQVDRLARSGIYTIGFSITGNPVCMDTNTELAVFRIVQESLNNIIKHAGASEISIQLDYNTDLLTLNIQDNGKGFYAEQPMHGTGLQNIKKRSAVLNGDVAISSGPNQGTLIKIKIPLYANNTTI